MQTSAARRDGSAAAGRRLRVRAADDAAGPGGGRAGEDFGRRAGGSLRSKRRARVQKWVLRLLR